MTKLKLHKRVQVPFIVFGMTCVDFVKLSKDELIEMLLNYERDDILFYHTEYFDGSSISKWMEATDEQIKEFLLNSDVESESSENLTNYLRVKNMSLEKMEEEIIRIINWSNSSRKKIVNNSNFIRDWLNSSEEEE